MNYPHIRLFARTCINWKDNSEEEAYKFAEELRKEHIQHFIQSPHFNLFKTKRKNKPFDCEYSFYDWQTIKQMCDEFGEKK